MFRLYSNKNHLTVKQKEPLTSGSVNVNQAEFTFSSDWEGLTRTAVFRAGSEVREAVLDSTGVCTLPWEVLAQAGREVYAGVYGSAGGGEIVLPTVWAYLGTVAEGTVRGEDAHPPTPDLWEQELEGKGDALEYDGVNLTLASNGKPLSSVQIAGAGGSDESAYVFGHGLKQEGSTVSVNTVGDFSGDNTLPMTAAGVYASVGNIEALLETI